MFVLLYTGEDQQWEFCLLEAGLFEATHPACPLIVLHNPANPIPPALSHLNAVKVTVPHIKDWLSPVFYDDPWGINRRLSAEKFNLMAEDLVRVFHSEAPIVTHFDLVPSFA